LNNAGIWQKIRNSLYFVIDKLDAVRGLEVGESVKSFVKDLDVSGQSSRYWKRQKTDLQETFKDAGHRDKKCMDEKVMKALKSHPLPWFKSWRKKGCLMVGNFIATKAAAIHPISIWSMINFKSAYFPFVYLIP